MKMRINCSSTCKSLCLLLSLACMKCKSALEQIQLGGKPRTKFRNCQKLWQPHYENHRKQRLVDQHNKVMAYLEGQQEDKNTTNNNNKESTITSIFTASLQVPTAQPTTPQYDNNQEQQDCHITPESTATCTLSSENVQGLKQLHSKLVDNITKYLWLKAKIENKCDSPPDAALDTQLREKIDSF